MSCHNFSDRRSAWPCLSLWDRNCEYLRYGIAYIGYVGYAVTYVQYGMIFVDGSSRIRYKNAGFEWKKNLRKNDLSSADLLRIMIFNNKMSEFLKLKFSMKFKKRTLFSFHLCYLRHQKFVILWSKKDSNFS